MAAIQYKYNPVTGQNEAQQHTPPPKKPVNPNDYLEDDPSNKQFKEYTIGGEGKVPSVQGVRAPDYSSYLKAAVDTSQNFAKNKGAIGDRMFNAYADVSRRDLAENIRGVKNDFNSRGLLGSGLQQKAQAGAVGAANQDLMGKRAEINKGLLDTQKSLEGSVRSIADMSLAPGEDISNSYLEAIRSNIARMYDEATAQNQLFSQAASGLTSLGGGIAGATREKKA